MLLWLVVAMDTLFPPSFPDGFSYVPDFITEEEEATLCKDISELELHAFNFQGFEAKRRVASFGYDYNFDKGALSKGKEIPPMFDGLISKVASRLAVYPGNFVELLVTEYPAGAVINWHRDAPPFDLIVGLSLLADCKFRLRPHDKAKQSRKTLISFPVRRRSLYTIAGKARTEWQHSIAPVSATRYSITLRTLRNGEQQQI